MLKRLVEGVNFYIFRCYRSRSQSLPICATSWSLSKAPDIFTDAWCTDFNLNNPL